MESKDNFLIFLSLRCKLISNLDFQVHLHLKHKSRGSGYVLNFGSLYIHFVCNMIDGSYNILSVSPRAAANNSTTTYTTITKMINIIILLSILFCYNYIDENNYYLIIKYYLEILKTQTILNNNNIFIYIIVVIQYQYKIIIYLYFLLSHHFHKKKFEMPYYSSHICQDKLLFLFFGNVQLIYLNYRTILLG